MATPAVCRWAGAVFLGHLIIWARAVRPKTAKKTKQKKYAKTKKVDCGRQMDGRTDRRMDGQTDGRTDGRTDKAGCRVAWHVTKNRKYSYHL